MGRTPVPCRMAKMQDFEELSEGFVTYPLPFSDRGRGCRSLASTLRKRFCASRNAVFQFSKDEATVYELINEVFEPQEQVNEAQANLLGAAFELVAGGQAQVHVGTGSGGSSSELPWNDKDKYSNKQTTTRR